MKGLSGILSSVSPTTIAQAVSSSSKYSYKANTYTTYNNITGQIETHSISEVGDSILGYGLSLRNNIDNIIKNGRPWPQTTTDKGFLPPILVTPNKDFRYGSEPAKTDQYSVSGNPDSTNPESKLYSSPNMVNNIKVGEYEYTDWMGQLIKINPDSSILDTSERFNESKNIPKTASELQSSPYSTRDTYLIFGDTKTDYFKHGLQVIDNLTPIENPEDGKSTLRLGQFQETPFENNDPVIFGFEIIIDDYSSPLLNGSITDFLTLYSGVDEIKYKIPVYEDFKQQFSKLFRTKSNLKVNLEQTSISKSKTNYAHTDSPKNIFGNGRSAYLGYYLKKVGGLQNLIESNTSDKKKFLVDYGTDVITLDFFEDVSLSVGTLAHLYKLLYWSKPNGKGLVPENLLRFNCDIIVSECRNFNRVRKAIDTGNLEVIKDNVSRYIYSLKECQFFFNTMPHNADVDLSAIQTYDTYSMQFDYKYSAVKFEKFMPNYNEKTGNFGKYVGYDGGAIWKIGNPGARAARGATQTSASDTSLPRFFTAGGNAYSQNGVTKPFILNKFGINLPSNPAGFTTDEKVTDQETNKDKPDLEKYKRYAKDQTAIGKSLSKLVSDQNKMSEFLNSPQNVLKTSAESAIQNFAEKNKNIGIPLSLGELTNKKTDTNIGNFIERLKDQTVKSVKQELTKLVDGRVSLLSRTINKLLIGEVGGKGVSPPQNVYIGPQDPMGIAMTNIGNRFFYDVRNDLADFVGGAVSNVLNGTITSITKK